MKFKVSLLSVLMVVLFAGNAFAAQELLDVLTYFDGDGAGLNYATGGVTPGFVDNFESGPTAKDLWFSGTWRQNNSGSIVGYMGNTGSNLENDGSSGLGIDLGVQVERERQLGATAVNLHYENPDVNTSPWAALVTVVLNQNFNGSAFGDVFGVNSGNVFYQEALSQDNMLVFALGDLASPADNANNVFNLFQFWVKDDAGTNYIIQSLLFDTAYPGGTGEVIELHGLEYNPATATPIPGAAWLLGSGLVGLIGLRRRFRA